VPPRTEHGDETMAKGTKRNCALCDKSTTAKDFCSKRGWRAFYAEWKTYWFCPQHPQQLISFLQDILVNMRVR